MIDSLWHQPGDKQFSYGVDRGMVYPHTTEQGVPWNGLVSVSESIEGDGATPVYVDGQAVAFDVTPGRMKAVIEAFHYPEEFGEHCLGESAVLGLGLTASNQPRGMFDLSYRRMIGDDRDGSNAYYQIVLLTGAIATDSDRDYNTVSDTTDPAVFSWDVDTQTELHNPAELEPPEGELPFAEGPDLPTARLVIDTRRVAPELVEAIEEILYHESNPRFVNVEDIKNIVVELTPDPVVNLVTNPRGRPTEEVEGDPIEARENLLSSIAEYIDNKVEWSLESPVDTSLPSEPYAENLIANPRGRTTSGTVVVVQDYALNTRRAIMEDALSEYTDADISWSTSTPSDESQVWIDPNTGVAKEFKVIGGAA